MQVADFDERRAQLTTRAKAIILEPAGTWTVVAAESTDQTALLRDYAAPLAAIPAICNWIGMSIIGLQVPLYGTVRIGIVRGLITAIVSWVLALVGVWIAALVVQKLAPTFQSRDDVTQATKMVVYANTPVWVAGVLLVIPMLSPLLILAAIYCVYLFYLGLTPVMGTPRDKVIPYMAVAAIVIIVVTVVLRIVTASIVGVGSGAFGGY